MAEKKLFWSSPWGVILLGAAGNVLFWGITAVFGFLPKVWSFLSTYAPLPLALLAATVVVVETFMRRRSARKLREEVSAELEANRKAAAEVAALRTLLNELERRLSAIASQLPTIPKGILTKEELEKALAPLSNGLNAQIQSIWQNLNDLHTRMAPIESLPADAIANMAKRAAEAEQQRTAIKDFGRDLNRPSSPSSR